MAGNVRREFAERVERRKRELMTRNRELSELEAFRLASAEISKDKEFLAAYRADSTRV